MNCQQMRSEAAIITSMAYDFDVPAGCVFVCPACEKPCTKDELGFSVCCGVKVERRER